MEAEDLVNDGIKIGKTVGKFIVRRICIMLEKLVAQLYLDVRISRELNEGPLKIGRKRWRRNNVNKTTVRLTSVEMSQALSGCKTGTHWTWFHILQ